MAVVVGERGRFAAGRDEVTQNESVAVVVVESNRRRSRVRREKSASKVVLP
jgi:hypothetical protein